MLRLLKDPLIHFLLLGGLIFALYAWRGEPEGSNPYQIVISGEEAQSIVQALSILHGRAPTRDEVLGTLEPTIREEILYREAIALGLDQDDSQVRMRLAEKMLFLTQDTVEPVPPTDTELEAFFAAAPERFRAPRKWTFEQIFFSPSQHDLALEAVAADALAELRAGTPLSVEADELLFEASYELLELAEIERLFGGDFAASLEALAPGSEWQGPIRSDFGMHLLRLLSRVESMQPELDDIRAEVLSALVAQRRSEANRRAYQELRDRYEVVTNLPELSDDAVEATEAGE